jgi:hypothetical protein
VVESPAGVALAIAALNLFDEGRKPATLSDSVISGNALHASSTTGSAQIHGVGLANNGPAVLTNVRIIGNTGKVTAPDGWIHGGGIFNGHVFPRPTPALTLQSTTVTRNSITGSAGTSIEGGGARHRRAESSTAGLMRRPPRHRHHVTTEVGARLWRKHHSRRSVFVGLDGFGSQAKDGVTLELRGDRVVR